MFNNAGNTSKSIAEVGNLKLCRETHTLFVSGKAHHLRNKLFLLFDYLVNNPNKLIKRKELITNIWDGNYYIGEKGLTHAVCMLRNILKKDPDCGVVIDTVPKTGYRMRTKNHKTYPSELQQSQEHINIDIKSETPNWWPMTSVYSELSA